VDEMQIGFAIRMRKKDIAAIDTALGYVVGNFWDHAPRISRHIPEWFASSEFL